MKRRNTAGNLQHSEAVDRGRSTERSLHPGNHPATAPAFIASSPSGGSTLLIGGLRPATGLRFGPAGIAGRLPGNPTGFTGNAVPFTGNLGALAGDLGAVTGNRNALTDNVGALTSNVGLLTRNIGALTDNVGGLTGNVGRLAKAVNYYPGDL